ncbi:PepSY-associated transmembrane protein [Litorimonas taeanensis]|uniref:PepSY-associated transmembrane protein n=1 Tax=Litorimonas taeanensis TaxID=568099 RepID=A0A420WJ20_9PROT|nr:PepSY domain-containing protein [Litorimonas taeanensis]RKQ71003.1 PepSY-associated transmembrane protein [Litorimonas taeanensis]
MSRNFFKYLTRAHKWAGLILSVQILFWFSSGLFFTLFPIDEVRGRHLTDSPSYTLSDQSLLPIEIAMTTYDGQLTGAKLISVAGRPAYVLLGDSGSQLIDARTGSAWAALGEGDIRRIAEASYKGEGKIAALSRLDSLPKDYRGGLPVWQVKFDDKAKTRLYLDPQTAEIRATRTRLWRVFDFMWKLHIMDVTGEDNFNAWWLRLAAFCGFLFALSGVALLWHRLVLRPRPKRINRA